ncbi:hypothetical protein BSLG_009468 [Batrachochytrium salamandrivorans]|nr:hypothetical protein BSLG_009468 [Batrachochytrium salamandrivorans]
MAPLLPLPASSLDIHPSLAATVVTTINDNSHDNTNINYTTGISELMAAMQGIQRNKEATRSKRDEELVRLMLQSLHQMGYSYTALCLQQESVKQQKYLEFLEIRDAKRALSVLRNELSPLAVSRDQIHKLSSEELYQKSNWNEHISPSMMIPTKRLNILMDQAIQLQVSQCLYHNPLHEHISLYANHMCDRNAFPITTTHILEEHTDEVWFLAYSPDGTMLASASKDARAIIWDANSLTARFILEEHSEAVSFLSWRPDSTMLLTASNDHKLKLWGSKTGVCILTFARHTEPVTSCAWLPNGERFVSGSLDKNIYLWNLAGDVLCKWTGVRIMDLAISIDGHTLIASSNSTIRLYDLDLFHEIGTLQENDSITSVYVASDGKHLLVNLSVQVRLCDID